jgi:hypothetical protein
MKIEILDSAEEDLIDGFKFYENQSNGLEIGFRDLRASACTRTARASRPVRRAVKRRSINEKNFYGCTHFR